MTKYIFQTLIITLFILLKIFSQQTSNDNLIKIKSYPSLDKVVIGSELFVAIEVEIAETWHINSNAPKDEFMVPTNLTVSENNKIESVKVSYPPAKEYKFDFSDTPVNVWEGKFYIPLKIKFADNIETGKTQLVLTLEYQACNNISCLAPNSISDTLIIDIVDKKTPVNQINSEIIQNLDVSSLSENNLTDDDSLASKLEKSGLLLSLILVFIGGLALNLTPCVYPLIPITIGYFGGQSEGKSSKLALMGLLFVLGLAVTYSIVGVVTSLTGAIFGALLQNPIVIIFIVTIFIALSLSMFGVFEFKLPDFIVTKASTSKSGFYGSFFMGLTMGIIAAPCIGPFVLGLVTYVAAKGDAILGFLMFFVLALGLGFPYLFLAIFSGKIKSLPKAGLWMQSVKNIFGLILLGMAIYFLLPLLPKTISSYLLPGFSFLAALYLLFFDKTANSVKGFRIFKTIFSIIIIVTSIYFMIPSEKQSIAWIEYSESELKNVPGKKGLIIDFYADWCIPCKELDALTFSNQQVIEKSKEFVTLKADLTKTLDSQVEKLREKYNIIGVPTILIFNSEMEEIHRITGFISAEEFLQLLNDKRLE